MGLFDWLKRPLRPQSARAPLPDPAAAGRALAGGRTTTDDSTLLLTTPRFVLPPPGADGRWRLAELSPGILDRISPFRLLELLADSSPEISRALWDFQRLCNPGYEVTVLRPGTDDPDPRGQAAIDELLALLTAHYGTPDVVINRLFLGAYLRGAFFGELVLDPVGRMPVDLATPDPATARFERAIDELRGPVWQLGQYQAGKGFVALDRPTVRYIPVDPLPSSPYGRAPAAPGLFPALFVLGLLHDLRRVIAQQGYPRLDISIALATLAESMPDAITGDPETWKRWVDAVVGEVKAVFAGLQPDETYVHTDAITVNRPVGAVDSDSLGAIDGIITALERMSVRALKTMPLMFGITDGVSEANANRQWEIHAAGVKALQHLCETFLGYLFGLALRAQGIPATVRCRFAELRAAEEMRDAQTEAIKIQNATNKYLMGWQSHEASALEITGHEPDLPEPIAIPGGLMLTDAGGTSEPGANRVRGRVRAQARAIPFGRFTPAGAGGTLPALPDEVTYDDAERRGLLAVWDAAVDGEYAGLLDAEVVGDE